MMLATLNSIHGLPDWVHSAVLPLNRWLHIVATTTLVGGAFFYEFVIPKAIEDLNGETQLAVLGRTRWIFRRVVNFSAITLIITGIVTSWRLWPNYHNQFKPVYMWWVLHVGLGMMAVLIIVLLTYGDRVPKHPFTWLRVVFVVMLVAMFAAAVARHLRLSISDEWERYYFLPDDETPYPARPVPADSSSEPSPSVTHMMPSISASTTHP